VSRVSDEPPSPVPKADLPAVLSEAAPVVRGLTSSR
jgi:hypothetical protein